MNGPFGSLRHWIKPQNIDLILLWRLVVSGCEVNEIKKNLIERINSDWIINTKMISLWFISLHFKLIWTSQHCPHHIYQIEIYRPPPDMSFVSTPFFIIYQMKTVRNNRACLNLRRPSSRGAVKFTFFVFLCKYFKWIF